MNVLFVSQCSKRALTQTRRILDQFAERKGERSWQTPITQAGLDTVRKLLRTTARKNTAIACHWIRARDHSELLWIVGDASQFNMQGTTPTNTTSHNVLRSADESTWHHLPLLTALTALAALIHDLGKATQAFQDRLCDARLREVNRYRHEWVSVRLFQSFVGPDASSDADWLERLTHCAHAGQDEAAFEALWLDHSAGRLIRDGLDTDQSNAAAFAPRNPFRALPPLAQCVAWLVLTHHRLPCKPVRYGRGHADQAQEDGERTWRPFGAPPSFVNRDDLRDLLSQIHADWNQPREHADTSRIRPYWSFPQGLPVGRKVWRKQAARYALKIAQLHSLSGFHASKWLADPFLMHIARMCLMLADHHYSRLSHDPQGAPSAERKPYLQIGAKLHANTCFTVRGERVLNQTLDEHLLGVQAQANLITHSLPKLARCLPALLNHRGLKKRSAAPQFHWQNKAADLATSLRHQAQAQGGFIINMASTGCGKTLGNARIMNALADPLLGMRCAFAIGLRTLTLQTGRSFQHDLGLNDEQLAIKVGGAASKALFEYHELKAQETGSASSLGLLDEGGQVLFEGDDRHPLLQPAARFTGSPFAAA